MPRIRKDIVGLKADNWPSSAAMCPCCGERWPSVGGMPLRKDGPVPPGRFRGVVRNCRDCGLAWVNWWLHPQGNDWRTFTGVELRSTHEEDA